jgi:hypothetical protein
MNGHSQRSEAFSEVGIGKAETMAEQFRLREILQVNQNRPTGEGITADCPNFSA